MSARIPAMRLGNNVLASLKTTSTYWTCPHSFPLRACRNLTTTPHLSAENNKASSIPALEKDTQTSTSKNTSSNLESEEISNPILEKYLEKQEAKTLTGEKPSRPKIREGSLPSKPHSIFKPEFETSVPKPTDSSPQSLEKWKAETKAHRASMAAAEEMKLSSLKLDPDPRGRKNWERKMVITSLRKRGRLTKEMKLKREERESRYKSQFLPTSIKKLTKIMNQIAGKTVEDALVQLRFSKKKVARDVWKGLKMARDEAIVARGMGLGMQQEELSDEEWKALKEDYTTKQKEKEAEKARKAADMEAKRKARYDNSTAPIEEAASTTAATEEEATTSPTSQHMEPSETEVLEHLLPDGMRRPSKESKPTTIELKNGKSKRIYDPTEMYIDQAWVGRGTPQKSPEFRARGKVNMLTHRMTSFSVVLKEEKTRLRISEEIKKKRASRKLWVALPDRPVTAQRQYCLW